MQATVPFSRTGDSPADAVRLARNLRDMARELERRAALSFAVYDGIGRNGAAWFGARRASAGLRSLIDALVLLTPALDSVRPADLLDTS
jgi:hypothetical protein